MKKRNLEIFVGLLIIFIVCVFSIYSFLTSSTIGLKSYTISATFNNIGLLTEDSKVSINGYEVGKVSKIELIYPYYKIRVTMDIKSNVKIPVDSILSIQAAGIFDAPMIAITAGKNTTFASNKTTDLKTKDWMSLEDRIGSVLFNSIGN